MQEAGNIEETEIGLNLQYLKVKNNLGAKQVTASKFQGDLCCCLVSDSILSYSILTPRYLADLTSWT